MSAKPWYEIDQVDKIDSPALVVYPAHIQQNIDKMLNIAGDAEKLFPHVKTHKMEAVVKMQLQKGIKRFKCATIAEAEMAAQAGASEILLAYPAIGPKVERFKQLCIQFKSTQFSTLIDSQVGAEQLSAAFSADNQSACVWIDVDVGMHRTGVNIENLQAFFHSASNLPNILIKGFHAYDGHIYDSDKTTRFKHAAEVFEPVKAVRDQLEKSTYTKLPIIAGGTSTFPFYIQHEGVLASPGTSLLWDEGYHKKFPDLQFDFGALLIARVVSKPQINTICIDLGYKAVASENPLPRVTFLNLPDAEVIFQSEEHMVLKTDKKLEIGAVLYVLPIHICPSCALYDEAIVIENNQVADKWAIAGRRRSISI